MLALLTVEKMDAEGGIYLPGLEQTLKGLQKFLERKKY